MASLILSGVSKLARLRHINHGFIAQQQRCWPRMDLIYNQVRLAGHAKWQNIASTKRANDLNKCRTISRYVLLVRRAIINNSRQTDPKLNTKLADVLAEASRMNVPKATLDRAIARAVNIKIISHNLELQGPGGTSLILRCETDNVATLRRDIRKIAKKFDAVIMNEDTLINMFQSRGFIRAATKTRDQREIDADFAEEAAILSSAEEVNLEINEDIEDQDLKRVWVFNTDANNLNPCRGELEKLGIRVLNCELDLVPYRSVDFGEEIYQKVEQMIVLLREHEQVIDVYHNLSPPKQTQEAERENC